MTEKKPQSGYRRTERTLNGEIRSLRAKLARVEHVKGEHEELTEIYRALVDNSAQGLAIVENGRIVFANRNMETLTGYGVEELRAMSAEQVRTLVHPKDRQAVWTRHRDRLSGQDPENPYDFRFVHRNGTVRWLRLYASRINYHGRDAVQAAYVDITEQKQAEEREAHVKRVLLAIRNVNQLIVAETDPQRLIDRACANLTETLGYFNAWIALFDDRGRAVTMTGASGFDGHFELMREQLERGVFPACMTEALREQVTVVVDRPKKDCPGCPVVPAYGDRAGLARRLAFDSRVNGVLGVSVPEDYAHDAEHQALFEELADDLGFALHKIETTVALRDSEARYRRFVETALEGVWAMNAEHETTFVNERMASMLGCTRQQMLGRRVEDFMFEEDLPAHRGRMQSRHKGKGGQYEHRFRRADGREVWTLVSATAIVSEQGQFGGSFAMFTDITERRRALQTLEYSEQRYRALFEGSPVGIGLATREGHVLMANRAMEELFGYTAEELEQLDIADLYEDPNDRAALLKHIAHKGCVSNHPARLRHKSGRLIDVLLSTSLIRSEDGPFLQTMCVDVTDHRRAQEALEFSYECLELAGRCHERKTLLEGFLTKIQAFTGCEGIGIRLLDEAGNIPYEAYAGFDRTFYESESPLSIKTDQCMCINVITGDTDPALPFYTEQGSFYMNGTTRFLASVPDEDKGRTRNVCNETGFESVGLIPIRMDGCILGLIHVADPRENMVPHSVIEVLETVGRELGVALRRIEAEEQLRISEDKLATIFDSAPVIMIVVDKDRRVCRANRACLEATGHTAEQVRGLRGGHVMRCLHSLDHPDGCGFGEFCQDCVVRKITRTTLETGEAFRNVEAHLPLRVGPEVRDRIFQVSTSRVDTVEQTLTLICMEDVTDRVRATEMLRQSEERFRVTMNQLPGTAWAVDRNLRFTVSQGSTLFDLGLKPDEVVGMTLYELFDTEDPAHISISQHLSALAGRTASYEQTHLGITFQTALSPIYDAGGHVVGVAGLSIDITKRKRAEESLWESEERLRLALKATNDVVWDWDVVRDAQRWNPAGATVFGWKDIVEAPQTAGWWVQRVHPEDRQRVDKGFFAVVNDPARNHWQDEYRFRRADGSYAEVLDRGYVMRNDEGEAVRMIGAMLDITERKRAEEALNRQRAELQAIYDHAPVMMCVLDADRRVLFANRAFTEFTGVSESDLRQGRACGVFGCINAKDDPRGCGFGPACQGCDLRRALDVTLRTGVGHRNIEYRATIEHNTSRRDVVLIGATAAIHTGEQTNALLCLEDRTEQEQAEHQARQRELELLHVARLSTLGEMASGLAHELSQPLSAILNYGTACANLISAERPDAERIARNIRRITDQSQRASDIMVRIKEFARRDRPHLTSVDLNPAVAGVLELLSWQIRRHGIDLSMDLDDRLPLARADLVQIEQVLVNLTRNAIEAMEQSPPPRRRLTIRTAAHDARTVGVEICDSGSGIPEDDLELVFDAFFTTKAKGLGMGLPISRTIVEMHEGTLIATRNPDGGSTFVMVLPMASNEPEGDTRI